MENFVVYLHINPYNMKKYVGITENIKERWRSEGRKYKERTPKFYADIVEYGWNNIIHLVLYEGLSKERAEFVETELIHLFDSVENGYNKSYGNGNKGNGKKVICTTTNKIFNNINEAMVYYGIKGRNIGNCCKGRKYKSCGKLADGTKLQWRYYEDFVEEQKKLGEGS